MRVFCLSILFAFAQLSTEAADAAGFQNTLPGRCLRGRVISGLSIMGRREEVLVMLEGTSYVDRVQTVMGASFSFCNIPQGDYSLEATAPGYKLWRSSLPNWSGSVMDTDVTIVLEPLSQPTLPPKGSKSVNLKALGTPLKALREHERFLQYAKKGDWLKSLESLEKAVAAYPDYFDAWNNMGIVLSKLKRDAQAEDAFHRAIEIEPKSSVARRNLGSFYFNRNRKVEARAELEQSARLNPQDPRTQLYLGRVLNELGQPVEAEEHLQEALALEPEMAPALYQLGFVNLSLNRTEKALYWFERYLKHATRSPASDEVRVLVDRLKNPS
jgi:tetratricopeptide (TPR) repeat protein